jgi:hypothetical protein
VFTLSLRKLFTFLALAFLGLAAPALAVTLLPQEQAIATAMITNPGQGRPALVLDPVIEAVARARAKDMAVRNYFSHVNPDGVAANFLLTQAGYQLPSWWGTDPTANYVESIAAGYSSPSATWTQWMNSPPHEEHLLAQNSFFASETHYGVGYYYDPNSTYQYYWVVITAPPEPVEVMSPEPSATVTGTAIPVSGLADITTLPAMVQYRVENTSGTSAYQTATGIASWTGTATGLQSGYNVIRAQTLDASGNLISQTTTGVYASVPATLTVTVSGSGVVTAGYAGVTTEQQGATVAINAYPRAGSIFTGWTGSIVSSSSAITFTAEPGISLQANFEPSPFIPLAGPYYGVLSTGTASTQGGMVRLALTSGGIFTGRVVIGSAAYVFHGTLAASGATTVNIPVAGQAPILLSLQADLTGGSGQITGTLTDGAQDYGFTVSQASDTIAPQAGHYTLVLAPDPNTTGTSTPQGNGFATMIVYPNGVTSVTGALADGTPYAAVGHVANDGSLAIYCAPSGSAAGSYLTGLLTFNSTDVSDVAGVLSWYKAPSGSAFYPAGFTTSLPCVGSRYTPPASTSGLQPMDVTAGAATAELGAGNLQQTLDVPLFITKSDRATMITPGAPNLSLAINSTNGVVAGNFQMPAANQNSPVRGVVLQKQQTAFGYFRGINQCGYFAMAPGQ